MSPSSFSSIVPMGGCIFFQKPRPKILFVNIIHVYLYNSMISNFSRTTQSHGYHGSHGGGMSFVSDGQVTIFFLKTFLRLPFAANYTYGE